MMKTPLIAEALLVAAVSFGAPPTPPQQVVRPAQTRPSALTPYEMSADMTPRTQIDLLVFAKLKQLAIPAANLCSDSIFLRRVYLDVIGTLPTPKEVKDFLADRDTNKRAAVIERLLARDEYVDFWANKWCDLLRVKAEFPINLWPNAAQAYHHWIWVSIKQNKPYDRFVRELLTANGSNFRDAPVNFYRAMQSKEPQAIAQTVALTFMGARVEKWPKGWVNGMSGFFSQIGFKETSEWKEEIVFFDPDHIANKNTNAVVRYEPSFPDGSPVTLTPDRDPREAFADWLVTPRNPWFTRNIANRIWFWLMGRGIIHEPDDIRADNPTSNAELLAYLEQELIGARYDLKHLFRLILNSKAYQLSCVRKDNRQEGDVYFSHSLMRRLDAEVIADALNQVTGTTEKYTSPIPEPFSFIPENQRSIALPDGSISSSFLELFGRPSRDTGVESERNNRSTAEQRLHLLNSSHVLKKIDESPKLRYAVENLKKPGELVSWLYLLILSRYPTPAEFQVASSAAKAGGREHEGAVDLAWALINSAEFLYRH